MLVICWLRVVAAIDLFPWRAVQVPDFKTETSWLHERVGKSSDANVVGLTHGRLNLVGAVTLDVAVGHKMHKVVCMRLHPSTGKELHESVSFVG
jgi:hypothetical protein